MEKKNSVKPGKEWDGMLKEKMMMKQKRKERKLDKENESDDGD